MAFWQFLFQPRIKTSVTSNDRLRSNLVSREANIGGSLFGELPTGHWRQFFCLDENTWVWHEGMRDATGKEAIISTRYEFIDGKIIKAQDGQPYQRLDKNERQNLMNAIREYHRRVISEIYPAKV